MRAAAPTDREPSVVFFVLTTARAISRRAGARTTTMWGGDGDGEGASFRFNFGGDAEADADRSASALPGATTSGTADVPSTADALVPASEVDPASAPDPTPGWSPETITVFDRTFVKGASSGAAARLVRGAGSDAAASDLVKGRYEGGFKLWECAEDLAAFLLRAGPDDTNLRPGARVLELGCGHALPGLAAAASGAREVILADYNPEVLAALTVPNVRANANAGLFDPRRTSFRYLAGDWGSLVASNLLELEFADVVLAAETVYDASNYGKHVDALKRYVAPGGVALVAAKAYYFGVGGGSRTFREALERDGSFEVDVAEEFSDGASNVREILRARRRTFERRER